MTTSISFCPFCGTQYTQPHNATLAFKCTSCYKTFFQNQNSTVCGVIIHDGKLLLSIRGRNPHKGLWDIPGGFVDPQEHPEQAVVREIREELNLDCKVEKLLTILAPQQYEFEGMTQYNCDHIYLLSTSTIDGLMANDDVVDYKFFTKDDLPDLKECAFECTKWTVQQFRLGKI